MNDILISPPSSKPYPIIFRADWEAFVQSLEVPSKRLFIVADSNTESLHGECIRKLLDQSGFETHCLNFPAGERSKTRHQKEQLEDQLLQVGAHRGDRLLAVGGGVTTDLTGFIAATYHRGMPWIAAPTSLLAQVDAAIGGKTGVNVPHGKNLIGAIHHPEAIWVCSGALSTLPQEEWVHGLAEVVKHAWIGNPKLFDSLEQSLPKGEELRDQDLKSAIQFKAAVVSEQDQDSGKREILNAGHTVAHAIEIASRHEVPHGQAVAMGLMVEAHVAHTMCGLPTEDIERLEQLLLAIQLPVRSPLAFDQIAPYLGADKKSQQGEIRCALPKALGSIAPVDGHWSVEVPRDLLESAWHAQGCGG